MRCLPGAGGVFGFDPTRSPLDNPALWRDDLLPVAIRLVAGARPAKRSKSPIDLSRALGIARAQAAFGASRQLHIGQGEAAVRLVIPRRMADRLQAVVPLDDRLNVRIASLRRLHLFLLKGPPGPQPRGWRLTPGQRRRLALILRTLDALEAGATYREIASALLDPDASGLPATVWKNASSRSAVMRLKRDGVRLVNSDYLLLLRGR